MNMKRFVIVCVVMLVALVIATIYTRRDDPFSPWSYDESEIYSVWFSPNDDRFAFTAAPIDEAEDTRLMVVESQSGRTLLETSGWVIGSACFDVAANYLAIFIGPEMVVYGLNNGTKLFSVSRLDIFEGGTAAMGFTHEGDALVLEQFGAFGFEDYPPRRIAFAVPSGERVEINEEPAFWYGRHLAADGSKWFGGGMHGPTPRVFRRDGEFIGYCWRDPNISYAWFTRDSRSLMTLHPDAALILWDFESGDDDGALQGETLAMRPELLDASHLVPLNTEDSVATIDASGKWVVTHLIE